ncbi:hypothetical protein ACIRD9_25530 [Streptomyces violaceus]|uniref:hypothetical protein n=1 Tax=Streptomyces violaceus TaxID=1936 RepID=UPI00381201B1
MTGVSGRAGQSSHRALWISLGELVSRATPPQHSDKLEPSFKCAVRSDIVVAQHPGRDLLLDLRKATSRQTSPYVRAVADAYGLSDMTEALAPIRGITGGDAVVERFLGGAPGQIPDIARVASPVHRVGQDAPPFQICHGTADDLVSWRHSWNLHEALVTMGAKSERFLLDGFINAARQGDLQFEDLLDNGRPAAEGAATTRRFAGATTMAQPGSVSMTLPASSPGTRRTHLAAHRRMHSVRCGYV